MELFELIRQDYDMGVPKREIARSTGCTAARCARRSLWRFRQNVGSPAVNPRTHLGVIPDLRHPICTRRLDRITSATDQECWTVLLCDADVYVKPLQRNELG